MGSYQEGTAALLTHIETVWPVLAPYVPLQLPNKAFNQPSSGVWARVSFLSDRPTEALAAGPDSAERAHDTIQLEVFERLETGTMNGLIVADLWASLWRGAPLPGFSFGRTQVLTIGRPEDNASLWKTDALTPYDREYQDPPEAPQMQSLTQTYTQPGNTFAVGDFVALGAAWVDAQANSEDTLAIGVVVRIRPAGAFDICHYGPATIGAHAYGAMGSKIYLSQVTPAAGTVTRPTAGLVQMVAQSLGTGQIFMFPKAAEFA